MRGRRLAKALLNPDVLYAFPQMLVASIELALGVVASISAYYLLIRRNVPVFQRGLKWSILVIIAPLQIYLGDATGLTVAEGQLAVLAGGRATTMPTVPSTPVGT